MARGCGQPWTSAVLRGDGHVLAVIVVVGFVGASLLGWTCGRASTAGERRHLRWLADHDVLTGKFNRAGFTGAALAAISAWVSTGGQSAAVMVIDLDGFKRVNDQHGHAAGDAVLVEVAAELQRHVVALGGVVARWGGDEFVVLLPARGPDETASMARGVSQLLTRSYWVLGELGRQRVEVGATVGAVLAEPGTAIDVDQLQQLADSAMYAAKRSRAGWSLSSAGTGPDPAGPGTVALQPVLPPETLRWVRVDRRPWLAAPPRRDMNLGTRGGRRIGLRTCLGASASQHAHGAG